MNHRLDISSGHAALDLFLADRFDGIRGMSSAFAAAICGHAIRQQSEAGIAGDILEIGCFEGRFFVAMALPLTGTEHAVGIDEFTWPNESVYDHFIENCIAAGLPKDRFTAWKANTRQLSATDIRQRLPAGVARFVHVDGDHDASSLAHDLELAHAVLHRDGIIAIDDMLHPGYPTLIETVIAYLKDHPEMRMFCIVDRESITAAAKFLICRDDRADAYERDLMSSFRAFHYTPGADFLGRFTLVLTPDPRLPDIG